MEIEETNILTLDDMVKLFFRIAETLKHPISYLDIELNAAWGTQLRQIKHNEVIKVEEKKPVENEQNKNPSVVK